MMKNYMTTGTFAKGKRPEGDSAGRATTPFPEEKVVMSIYGGPAPTSRGISSSLLTEQSMSYVQRSWSTYAGPSLRSILTEWTTQIASPCWRGFPS
jgi:hypothetical protein